MGDPMSDGRNDKQLFAGQEPYASEDNGHFDPRKMTPTEREAVIKLGNEFVQQVGSDSGEWLLISGRFTSGNGEKSTESQVKEALHRAFGYPTSSRPGLVLNVLLDSPGGSLDSAYTTVLYLSKYATTLKVFVPDRAKSASTLLAVGADEVYLSAFGELGPLDTQIPDPRNPANTVSALDCYQSVDYVSAFGFKTINAVLPELVSATERRISVNELLDTASTFAIGIVTPALRSVTALDFGGWGRSLRIGEHYARKLLQAKTKDGDYARADRIAYQLVYGYTHHLFPIDRLEANRIGLSVAQMEKDLYDEAIKVVEACHRKDFVGLLGEKHSAAASAQSPQRPEVAGQHSRGDGHREYDHPPAEAASPRSYPVLSRRWRIR
jgi:hypothetical protein